MANSDILVSLQPIAKAAAQAFCEQFPSAKLTSGHRSAEQQAEAMAANVIQNKNWIVETYSFSPVSNACQDAVDDLTEPRSAGAIAAVLQQTLAAFPPDSLRHLSWHLSGDAFDVEPTENSMIPMALQRLVDGRIAAGGQGKFLSKEGGLTRWHVQLV